MDTVDRIFDLIKKSGKSVNSVAVDCKVNTMLFTQWKKGRQRPGVETLIKIADYFGVSVDYLVGREVPANSGSVSGQTVSQTAPDAATSPILDAWAGLDEIQQAKVLAYAKGLQDTDIRNKGVVTKF